MRLPALALVLLVAAGCKDKSGWDTIEGTVVDERTRAPIAGATIVVNSGAPLNVDDEDRGKTDAQGRFVVRAVHNRLLGVTLRAKGYAPSYELYEPAPRLPLTMRRMGAAR